MFHLDKWLPFYYFYLVDEFVMLFNLCSEWVGISLMNETLLKKEKKSAEEVEKKREEE